MDSISLSQYLKGEVSKEFILRRLVPLMLAVLGFTILIANLFFPEAYDWRYMVISDLTSSTENPDGFLYLSVGMAIAGVLMIPVPAYLHKRLSAVGKPGTILGTLFFYVGILGLILVGLIYDAPGQPNRLHENLAIVAFGGLLFSIFFWGFPIMRDLMPRFGGKQQFNKKLFLIGAAMMWFAVLGTGISALYLEVVENDWGWVGIDWIEKGAPVLASFALWEWIIFVFLLTYLILLIELIPEQMQPEAL